MPNSYTELYTHYTWHTWDREPLISAEMEPRLHACIAAKCEELQCQAVEINGTETHVHVLVRLSALVSVAQLAHGMKGASSHLVTHALGATFKWRGCYGAFSVGPAEVNRVRAYVRNQKQHHAANRLEPAWERDEKFRDP